jgi:hypothetical protein
MPHHCELSSSEICAIFDMKKELEDAVEKAKQERQGYWYLSFRDSDTAKKPEVLQELVALWQEGAAFLLTCVVNSPYDGCFHEPQIFLVTPPTCDEALTLQDVWPGSSNDPVVWPLYASGQGCFVDCLKSCADIARWMTDQSLADLAAREGGAGSTRIWAKRCHATSAYGSFDSFMVHEMQPLNQLPPAEHYWGAAVKAAEREYEISLPWVCSKCEKEKHGAGDCEQEPIFTGYRGNGGIGVFMEGALCYDCVQAGMCRRCEERGGDYSETYDPDVAEHGWDLCEYCTEELLKELTLICIGDAPDLPANVYIHRHLVAPNQLLLPGCEPEIRTGLFVYDKTATNALKLLPVAITGIPIEDAIHAIGLHASDFIDGTPVDGGGEGSYRRGLQLPGRVVEKAIEEIENAQA